MAVDDSGNVFVADSDNDQIVEIPQYDAVTMALKLVDIITQATVTKTFPIDIPGPIEAGHAWVGFTAGTGRLSAVQNILGWNYSY
jgi:hypothetical protein